MLAEEALAQRIERGGPDVAVDDAERAERERQQRSPAGPGRVVVRDGVVYFPSEVYPKLGVRPFTTAPVVTPGG